MVIRLLKVIGSRFDNVTYKTVQQIAGPERIPVVILGWNCSRSIVYIRVIPYLTCLAFTDLW